MPDRMKVAIVTSGYFPVPPTRGGAVEALVQYLLEENERQDKIDLIVYSCYDEDAVTKSVEYPKTDFVFIRTPVLIKAADKIVYFLAKYIMRKKKHLSFRYILQRVHFIRSVGCNLARDTVDRIVLENHPTLLGVLDVKDNRRRYENKCIYHCHNAVSGFFGRKNDLVGCRSIVGVSDFVLRDLEISCGASLARDRLFVLKNRVDQRALNKVSLSDVSALRHRYSLPLAARVILFAGRLCEEKGALQLIEAFSLLEEKNSVLLILGSYYFGSSMKSAYEDELRARAERLGDRIVFTGFVAHEEMPVFYALADVVVAPSICVDAAPLSVVEPLTAGRPLVTTARGGIPEYATDGVDSVVLEVNDQLVGNMANAIDGILSGRINLEKSNSYDLSLASFYREFVGLVSR